MGSGSLVAMLLVLPLLAGQDEVGFEAEVRAAVVDFVAVLEEHAGWCRSKKLYGEREVALAEILVFEPDHRDARKALKHRRDKDGTWTVPENPKPAKNTSDHHLEECRERRESAGESFAERLFGVVGFYEDSGPEGGVTPARKAAVYELILTAHPGHAGVRAFRGEALVEERWVLQETARAKERRGELKALVQEAYAAVPALEEVELNAVESGMGLPFTALGTPRVRALGTVPRDELERAARTAHATFEVYSKVFDDPVQQLDGYTIYVLAGDADRDVFIRGWPKWGAARLAEVRVWAGAGVPEDIHVARWDKRADQRLDGVMRHTLGLCMKIDTNVGTDVAWAWEGLGMYLSRAMVGTRLTWYGSGQSTATAESKSKDLLSRLLNADVNWMNEAYQQLKTGAAPKLGPLLARDIDSMGVRDVLLAYAFAAYLLEGCPDAVPGILAAAGEGDGRSVEALEAGLGRGVDEIRDRLQRWLGERR